MGIILWIIFGALVGWISSMIMKTDSNQGLLMDVILGIIGAFVGGLIMNFLGYSGITGFNLYSLIVAVFGSILFIWISRKII